MSDRARGPARRQGVVNGVAQHPTSVSEPFVGAEVVAEFLSLSPRTIRGWASRGRIPCFKRNGTVRYRLSEVSDWFENGDRRPREGEVRWAS